MTDIDEIQAKVRTFIVESFLPQASGKTFRDDDDLLKLLDSLQILRMVIAFEREFAIKVEDGDMSPDNLGSVGKLASLIDLKLRNGCQCAPDGTGIVERPI